ncbi:centromere protein U isoform X2 [Melanotaenia boesemani]|uniref:centromere protein U isoform X2 n=1 Tax=Melanotaenia boesemani TaxID=1250792 RepID=UPI001C05E395|nr:centromere protein U isoform X2 [Melanotaenia boesemani]
MDSPNLSGVDKESFLEGLQRHGSNPLHSTAIEEDLNVLEEGQINKRLGGREKIPKTARTERKQRGAAMKRKEKEGDEEEETERKRSRKSNKVKAKSSSDVDTPAAQEGSEEEEKRSVRSSGQPAPTGIRRLVGKEPARKSAQLLSATRPVKSRKLKEKKRESPDVSSEAQSEEEGGSGRAQRQRRRVLSSDEEVDEETSWKPGPNKARMPSWGRARKSSSERSKSRKSSEEVEKASSDKRKRRRPAGRRVTDLEVVLDAFLEFCDQYRDSVESTSIQRSIDSFSNNVEEQLLEKISSCKELKVLKRENQKVGSLIHKKTQRLLDAKHELMRAERQVWLLQKEKAELQQRIADLRQGRAFLHDIRELNRQYLDHRCSNPIEKETYGAPSLPALLLETKLIQTTELQPSGINNQLGKRQKKNWTQK